MVNTTLYNCGGGGRGVLLDGIGPSASEGAMPPPGAGHGGVGYGEGGAAADSRSLQIYIILATTELQALCTSSEDENKRTVFEHSTEDLNGLFCNPFPLNCDSVIYECSTVHTMRAVNLFRYCTMRFECHN